MRQLNARCDDVLCQHHAHAQPCCHATQVSAHLYHKTWETRVAAGEALGLLADHFAHISVRDLSTCCQPANSCGADAGVSLTFKSFNLQHVLEKGSALLASGGQVGKQRWQWHSNLLCKHSLHVVLNRLFACG